jgi:anthranilate synthase component 1/salicylate synthetase
MGAWADNSVWEPMISPASLQDMVPATGQSALLVQRARTSICQVLEGTDDRLLVIVGPCSIHERESALDYADRLAVLAEKLSDDLVVVMRAYVEKSRTALGWPGLALAPELHGTPAPVDGFRLARSIMAEIVELGLPVGVEWLSLISPTYLGDLAAWGCIGARTVEGMAYRQMASALAMPIGMKNRTDGCVQTAVNAVRTAEREQAVLGIGPNGTVAVGRSAGNPHCHIVLRGGTNGPNWHPSAIREAQRLLRSASLAERLIIDASHGNSARDHVRQAVVARGIARQVEEGNEVIRGLLLESFLLPGRQDPSPCRALAHGQSVTDACMSWPVTAQLLTDLAQATRTRRCRRRAAGGEAKPGPRPRTDRVDVAGAPTARAVALAETGLSDTYVVYEREGTWTVAIGVQGSITLEATRIRRNWRGVEQSWALKSRPFAAIGDALASLPVPEWTAYGWIAFEAAHLATGRPGQLPDGNLAHLIVPQIEVRISTGTTSITSTASITSTDDVLRQAVLNALARDLPADEPPSVRVGINGDYDGYRNAVATAVREIHKGSFQKVILSRSVPVTPSIDVLRTYLRGRAANTPARSFLLNAGGKLAAGFCPETVLEADTCGYVSTQPLAGTRAFGPDPGENLRLRTELLTDTKELVEHTLSVQLAFDELKRVCAPDSVTVTDFLSVKERGSVQHLASRVGGRLMGGVSVWDALEAVFPAVTASGIPKAPACDFISSTEPTPRGLYAGAVLTASSDGALDAGLVLRAIFEENGRQWLRAGAGIIANSRPEREYEETCEKLRSVVPHLVAVGRQAAQMLSVVDLPRVRPLETRLPPP